MGFPAAQTLDSLPASHRCVASRSDVGWGAAFRDFRSVIGLNREELRRSVMPPSSPPAAVGSLVRRLRMTQSCGNVVGRHCNLHTVAAETIIQHFGCRNSLVSSQSVRNSVQKLLASCSST